MVNLLLRERRAPPGDRGVHSPRTIFRPSKRILHLPTVAVAARPSPLT
jgi:hypothetical protein